MSHLRPSKGADTANGERRVSLSIGGTMKAWIRIAMLVTLTVCGTIAPSAQEPDQSKPAAGAADDNMTPVVSHNSAHLLRETAFRSMR
jgi:hypothetical protein